MADLTETETYPAGIYQIEMTDPVLGGPPDLGAGLGITNVPAQQIANRTRWLKARVDALLATVVAATTSAAGIVKLSTSVSSTSTATAATSSAVKAANDNADTRVPVSRSVTGGGIATGGGSLTADRTITVSEASQAEAEAGTDNSKAMTPRRVRQAVPPGFAAIDTGLLGSVLLGLNNSGSLVNTGQLVAGSSISHASASYVDGGSVGAASGGTLRCMSRTPAGHVGLFVRIN